MSLPPPDHPEDSFNDDATPAHPVSGLSSPQTIQLQAPPTIQLSPSAQDSAQDSGAPRLASETWVRRHSPWLKRLLIATGILALLLLLLTLTTAIALRHAMHASLPQLDGNLSLAGLSSPVTITRDPQGVPSIHATNLDDLLFAQGFITAQDRLFQMDALRRHGAGQLAELLGPSLIDHDREQRILQLRAAADRATALLPADQLHQLQAYANGVNAFIDTHSNTHTDHQRSPSAQDLPIEFHILHYTPALWTPRDSLLIALVMSQDLSTDFPTKLNREALAAHLPASILPDLYPVGSWRDHPPTQTPTDLTAPANLIEQIPLDRTQSLNHLPAQPNCRNSAPSDPHQSGCPMSGLSDMGSQDANSRTQPRTSPHDLLTTYADLRAGLEIAHDPTLAVRAGLHSHLCDGCRAGSNNWVVAGSHTATGAPLLSNDMHLSLTAPDIWYEAALHADGPTPLSVEGFTLPGVPFIIVGRNPYVAWGFTNSGADVQDVLIEHLRGHGSNTEYEHPDHTWSLVGHQIEHIRVRAGHDITLDVLTTTHAIGATQIVTPIISPLYQSEHRALSLAWTLYDPSTVTSPFLAIDSAPDAASLVAAFASFATVSQNLVYADAHHIGYHLLGRIPIRGPAIQHPRPPQPFILPDATPSEDEDDESGNPQTSSLTQPAPSAQDVSAPSSTQPAPSAQDPTTPYTIGSPISPIPIDALDPTQTWSGYIPYDALPSVLDPTSGILATANARIVTDDYPYAITLDWADSYRVERINHLLENQNNLTPADMLRIQMDVHSEFDLLIAQRLAYALDHSALTQKDPRLQQAANLLRDWNGDLTPDSTAANIVASARGALWSMLLAPHLRDEQAAQQAHTTKHRKLTTPELGNLIALYTWGEHDSALELILQHTPVRWLPHAFPNWNDFLATAVQRGFKIDNAPTNLSTWTYGPLHPVDIAHPIFGSHSPLSTLLGVPTGSGFHSNGGDGTTIKAAGTHFGPSERFTADLANPDNTQANITTGESGNPASPWFLDQFPPWLNGTTFLLPLNHPPTTHTLTLTPN